MLAKVVNFVELSCLLSLRTESNVVKQSSVKAFSLDCFVPRNDAKRRKLDCFVPRNDGGSVRLIKSNCPQAADGNELFLHTK